jgi:low affinity Fe/Cu permease
MKNNFWGFIWQSFLEIYAVPATFLGILISILAWIISAKTQISLALVITIAVFTVIIIITLFHSAYKAFRRIKQLESDLQETEQINQNLVNELNQLNQLKNPKILRVEKQEDTDSLICLLEESGLFVVEALISFYYIDEDGFEILIGGGFIQAIQSDGKMQAKIDKPIILP